MAIVRDIWRGFFYFACTTLLSIAPMNLARAQGYSPEYGDSGWVQKEKYWEFVVGGISHAKLRVRVVSRKAHIELELPCIHLPQQTQKLSWVYRSQTSTESSCEGETRESDLHKDWDEILVFPEAIARRIR